MIKRFRCFIALGVDVDLFLFIARRHQFGEPLVTINIHFKFDIKVLPYYVTNLC